MEPTCEKCHGDRDADTSDAMRDGDMLCASCADDEEYEFDTRVMSREEFSEHLAWKYKYPPTYGE